MQRVDRNGLTYYRNEAWADLRHGIFTRRGGASKSHWSSLNVGASNGDDPGAVKENQARMYRAVDVNPARVVSSWLVHSVDVLAVTSPGSGNGDIAKADGLVTNLADTPLVMRFADCVPLLLYDPVKKAIGLGHAGWRGTVNGMAANLARAMQAHYGSEPADIQALIGPAISRRNYPVGQDVVERALAYFGADADVIGSDPANGRWHFDLCRANICDLKAAGLRQVEVLDICTFENTADFYSHRAEKGRTGRFGVVISL